MKLVYVFAIVCIVLLSKETAGDTFYGSARKWRQTSATVGCPPGKKITGGGGACISAEKRGWVYLTQNRPLNDNEWFVKCDTSIDQYVLVEAYAICE